MPRHDAPVGSVSNMLLLFSYQHAEFVTIAKEAEHHGMQSHRLGKTDGLAQEPCQPSSAGEMFPVNLLRIGVANSMVVRLAMTRLSLCPIGIDMMNPSWGSQRFALDEDVVLRGPHYGGYDPSRTLSNGMPEPSVVGFRPTKPPQFVDVHFFTAMALDPDLSWLHLLDG